MPPGKLHPAKLPVAKLPFVTIEPGSLRASIVARRPASALSPATRKPASSMIAAAASSIWPPSVVEATPTAVEMPLSTWDLV